MKALIKSKLVLSLTALIMIAAAIAIPLSGSLTHAHAQGTLNISEFSIPTSSSDPVSITSGPDGNLWFTEFDGHKIGKVTPDGTVNDFLVPTTTSSPWGITSGPDGNLWFTEQYGSNKIGKSSTSGTMPPEYPVTTGNSNPTGIVTGPDGNLWFAEAGASQIGVMSTSGTMLHEYPVSSNSSPFSIIVGPDGYLYFTEYNGSKIGKMDTNGTIIGEYPTLTGNSNPSRLTTGPDGNIWFTEQGAGKIGKMSTSGTMLHEYTLSNSNSNPIGITADPDGNVWFVELYGSQIGKITPSGTITEYSLPSGYGYPVGITKGPDGNLWFTEAIGNAIGRVNLPSPNQATCLGTNTTTPTCYSQIYAGYVSTGPTNHPVTYKDVFGSWVVPTAANCSLFEPSNSAFWVGLGATSGGTLQQIGTNTGCGGIGNICPLNLPGIPAYCAWYQMFPHKNIHVIAFANNGKLAIVKPNDTIQAEVTYEKNGNFLLQIHDLTQKWDYSNTDSQTGSQLDSAREDADWIVEAPPFLGSIQPLTDFTTVHFSKCSADKKGISSAGPLTLQMIMTDDGTPTGTFKAAPDALSHNGTEFSVNWVSS
jgi:streptogramin lyase